MSVKQIAVFIENKTGRLYDVCNLLAQNNINLAAVTIADSSDFGIFRALTSDTDKSVEVLKNAGFVTKVNEILAVDVVNKPGALADVLEILDKQNINVNYMYSFADENRRAIMLIKVDDIPKTVEILKTNNFNLVEKPLA